MPRPNQIRGPIFRKRSVKTLKKTEKKTISRAPSLKKQTWLGCMNKRVAINYFKLDNNTCKVLFLKETT
jgi:hypothetical protein